MSETNNFKPLLNVYLIWHPSADSFCKNSAKSVFSHLNRDADKPFARSIAIPTYYRCVPELNKNVPIPIKIDNAKHTVIFVLVEDHMVFDDAWGEYIANLYEQVKISTSHRLIPIALSGSAFNLHTSISKVNFARLFDVTPDFIQNKLVHYCAHAIAILLTSPQRVTNQGSKLSNLPIKLFISHTTHDKKALALAVALKQALENTQLDNFFDSVDIAHGFQFDEEINANLENSALLAIRSDRYSDSPWCRMEVMTAKKEKCPIVVVDALQYQENRSFPYLCNVPVIRFDLNQSLKSPKTIKQLQSIIDFALLEVLRVKYSKKNFEYLISLGLLPSDAEILSRPPEESDFKNTNKQQIIYPDPPLGCEEIKELSHYKKQFNTPTTVHGKSLSNFAIGMSISELDLGELQALGLSNEHLQIFMLEIARQCLVKGGQLVYGGDLRSGGFTENLLELVRHHNDALEKNYKPVINHLAWSLKSTLNVAWAAENKDAIKIEIDECPEDLVEAGLIVDKNNPGDIGKISGYIWARCLSNMRNKIIQTTQARIMMGGRTSGFKGKYPGLVEEALLTLQAKRPLFLLGGFGGASLSISQALQGERPITLTQNYQCNDKNYEILLNEFNLRIANQNLNLEPIDYDKLLEDFSNFGVTGLNNGLSIDDNLQLFKTVNIEEAISLIMGSTHETEYKPR